jgi:hypothetical protein
MARKLSERSLRERDEADAEYKEFPRPMPSAARIATMNDLRNINEFVDYLSK